MGDTSPTKPGDEAPSGTPGTGENLCPACSGTGKVDGNSCPECKGTGKVTTGIGGG
jgi:RecJ-like exonuclease